MRDEIIKKIEEEKIIVIVRGEQFRSRDATRIAYCTSGLRI